MSTRRIAIAVTLTALLTILFVWLAGEQPLARLSSAEGTVDRDRRGKERQWQTASLGDELAMGDAVRTASDGKARLSLSAGTVLDVAPDTIVRLLSDAPGNERFRVETGSAELQVGELELLLQTSAGPVRVAKGGRIKIREQKGNTWVRVDLGRAELGWDKGERSLLPGQEAQLGGAATEALAATAPSEPRELPSAAPEQAPSNVREATSGDGVAAVVRGDVRAQRKGEQKASELSAGEHLLPLGTRVSVSANGSLQLAQAEGGSLQTQGKTELVVGDGVSTPTRVLGGAVRASAGKVPVAVEVPGGRLVLLVDEAGVAAAGTVRVGKQESAVNVDSGSITLRGKQGEQTLHEGGHGSLSARGKAEVDYHPPSQRDLTLAAGITTTIHDPSPPSAVSLQVAAPCTEGSLVVEQQVGGSFQERGVAGAQDAVSVLAWFPAGSTAYRVRCRAEHGVAKQIAAGRISVQRDAALRRVTKRAPELELDLDGRKYTTVYQTLLPIVRVRPPTGLGKGAKLRIEGPSAARTLELPEQGLTLRSGELGEGSFSLRAEPKTGAPGKPTTLLIQYDNAAPAAYLEGPESLSREADGSVVLRGGAVEESQLSIDGTPVALDRASRFEAKARPPAGARAVALSIKHPRLGSHYYVRRLQGAAP